MNVKNLKKLAEFLESDKTPDTCMNLSQLQGYITCLAITPEIIKPTDWLDMILSDKIDEEIIWQDDKDFEEYFNLLFSFYNSISKKFASKTIKYKIIPNEKENDERKTILTDWIFGFMKGTVFCSDLWMNLFFLDEFKSFYLLLCVHNPIMKEEYGFEDEFTDEHIQSHKEILELGLIDIYNYWLDYRKEINNTVEEVDNVTEEIERYSSVGRNDLCPCGSGKKFKKCCMN